MRALTVLATGYIVLPLAFSSFLTSPYVDSKWIVLFVFVGLSLLLLEDPVIFNLKRAIWLLTLGWILWPLVYFQNLSFDAVFLRLTFFSVVCVAARFGIESIYAVARVLTPISVLLSLIGLYQIASIEVFPTDLVSQTLIASTFGHSNSMSAFLVVAVLFRLISDSLRPEGFRKWVYFLIAVFVLPYVILLLGRSSILGLVLGLVFFSFSRHSSPEVRKVARSFLSFSFIVALFVLGLAWEKIDLTGKLSDFGTFGRLESWKVSLLMILDRPWVGVGPDQFAFEALPYFAKIGTYHLESRVFEGPHNEVFRILVENGLVGLGIVFALVFGFIRRVGLTWQKKWMVFLPIFLFLGLESVFHFPFETPFLVLVSGTIMGVLLGKEERESTSLSTSFSRIVRPVIGLVLLAWSGVYAVTSVRVPVVSDSVSLRVCKLLPEKWRYCLSWAQRMARNGAKEGALSISESLLSHNRFNLSAIRFYLRQRSPPHPKSCEAMGLYRLLALPKPQYLSQEEMDGFCPGGSRSPTPDIRSWRFP